MKTKLNSMVQIDFMDDCFVWDSVADRYGSVHRGVMVMGDGGVQIDEELLAERDYYFIWECETVH